MNDDWLAVCDSAELGERGDGVRFELRVAGAIYPAFVLRIDQVPRAYLNRCSHRPVELDWLPGRFLDDEARFIVCATHGALYDPSTGACRGGPCGRSGLVALPSREAQGRVWVRAPDGAASTPVFHP